MRNFMYVLLVVLSLTVVVTPDYVYADSQNVVQAYKDFSLSYSKLPRGKCGSTSLAPYVQALTRLERFVTLAEPISNKPDLREHRQYLEDIINSNTACFDPYAGISFRCIGDCPKGGSNLKYKEAKKLPEGVLLGTDKNLSVTGRNVSRATYSHSPRAGLKWSHDQVWYEHNEQGKTTFTFKEVGRDDWSVYLHDRSRDVQIQIDVHRMWVTYGTHNNPKRDLYKIGEVKSR